MFITLDGIDGVGKSTQIDRLSQFLTACGYDVLTVRDPGTTDVGQQLRSMLLDSNLVMHRRTEAMLFMASRCEMVETLVRPALSEGKVVISDRFLLSTVVYQSIGGDVSPADLWQLGRQANGSLQPDVTILLDMPAAKSMQRIDGNADRMESRGEDYMEQVRQAFLRELPNSSPITHVVSAEQSIDDIASEIQTHVSLAAGQKG